MNNNNNSTNLWTVIIIAFVLGAALLGSFSGNSSSSTSSRPAPSAVNRGSFEHRYVTERFKQEGFSSSDAQQAADAVIKFHNAQKNR